jgi:hypothetical protein
MATDRTGGTIEAMDLPVMPPVSPMLAKAARGIPTPDSVPAGLLYEPRWDYF